MNIIDYIDDRINNNPYGGTWVTNKGEHISADVEYVYEWWNECMKPELKEVFSNYKGDITL